LRAVGICWQLLLCWLIFKTLLLNLSFRVISILAASCDLHTYCFMWSPHLLLHVIFMWSSHLLLHVISTLNAPCDLHTCCFMWSPHLLLHVISTLAASCDLHSCCFTWSPHLLLHVLFTLIFHVISTLDVSYGDLHNSFYVITTFIAMFSTLVAFRNHFLCREILFKSLNSLTNKFWQLCQRVPSRCEHSLACRSPPFCHAAARHFAMPQPAILPCRSTPFCHAAVRHSAMPQYAILPYCSTPFAIKERSEVQLTLRCKLLVLFCTQWATASLLDNLPRRTAPVSPTVQQFA
jgi:hypothetical protein